MKRLVSALIVGVIILARASSVSAAVFSDDFNSGINTNMWSTYTGGVGGSVEGSSGRLKLSLAPESQGGVFGSGVASECKLRGDFDVQVDYSLDTWPTSSGARTGVIIGDGLFENPLLAVERIFFGNRDFYWQSVRDGYGFHGLVDGVLFLYDGPDTVGKFRVVRVGHITSGFSWDGNSWVGLGSSSMGTTDVKFGMGIWSHDGNFTQQQVDVFYDNLIVNSGELVDCPIPPTPTPLEVDLFKQGDPEWGGDVYAAGTRDNMVCGTTIAQCGCALSSAAMVLNYHGAIKDPLTGGSTTPETLNNYFKQNPKCMPGGCESVGYRFGSVIWPVLGNYSADANRIYGTQKIEQVMGDLYDVEVTRSDIQNLKPVILKVLNSNHWAVAVGNLIDTLALNDPGHNRTKLSDAPYNNVAYKMRRFEKTNSDFSFIEFASLAPTQLLVTDSQGRRTGYDTLANITVEEIPNSYYIFDEAIADDTGENPPPEAGKGVYIVGIKYPQEDKYNVEAIGQGDDLASFTVHASDRNGGLVHDIFESEGASDNLYEFNYSSEPGETILSREVEIDIKPGNDDNLINCKKDIGNIPVAILSSPVFDALQVDHQTVVFEGAKELHIDKDIVLKRHEEDVNGDGLTDLVFHFNLSETGLSCSSQIGVLMGKTFDGHDVQGVAVVSTK